MFNCGNHLFEALLDDAFAEEVSNVGEREEVFDKALEVALKTSKSVNHCGQVITQKDLSESLRSKVNTRWYSNGVSEN